MKNGLVMQKASCFTAVVLALLVLCPIGSGAERTLSGSKASAQKPASGSSAAKDKKASRGKKVLMIIAPKNFRDEELFTTRKVIEAAGHGVTLASTSTARATGMLGGTAKPDITIEQAKAEAYDAVVFVGGSGTRALLNHKGALSLARRAHGAGKLVAAICMAPEILANAGLLDGKKATSWKGGRDNLRARGAKVSNAPVVTDGRLITGGGPSAARAFGEAIVAYLSKH